MGGTYLSLNWIHREHKEAKVHLLAWFIHNFDCAVFCSPLYFIAVSYLYFAKGYTTAMYLSADMASVLYMDPIYCV